MYAIQFAQQDDFIPLIEKWLADGTRRISYSGLAMRPDLGIADILLKSGEPNAVAAMRFLRPNQVHGVIPQLIKRLTHSDNQMRAQAEQRLRGWTGQSFHHTWRGYHYERPTLEEGDKMQLYIPPGLGYGDKRAGPIEPNSTLIFDVELISVNMTEQ